MPYQLTKFQASSSNTLRYLADKILFYFLFSKGYNSRKGDNTDKKKKSVSYFFMRNPYMKFQNPSMHGSWRMDARTHTRKTRNQYAINFFKVGGIMIQDFVLFFFSKGHNSRKGDNSDKKKNVSAIFPWGIHIWNFKTLACMVLDEWMHARKHGQPETNMPCQLLQSWGHNDTAEICFLA